MSCEIQGCRRTPYYLVGRPRGSSEIRVCRKCMEELVSEYGYSLVQAGIPRPQLTPGHNTDYETTEERMRTPRYTRGDIETWLALHPEDADLPEWVYTETLTFAGHQLRRRLQDLAHEIRKALPAWVQERLR
jgi:hypothetical protein